MLEIFAVIGAVAIFGAVFLASALLWEYAKEKFEIAKWEYKRKHRFDKPPTAKCYCVDCIYYRHNKGYGKCTRGHIDEFWNIADSWFCWQAEPYKRDPDMRKKVEE